MYPRLVRAISSSYHQHLGGLDAAEGAHRQVFQDALLDLLQAIELGLQDAFGSFQVQIVFGDPVPGQGDQEVQVIEADIIFRHRRVGLLQPFQLLQRHCGHCLGQPGLLHRGPQLQQLLGYLGGALLFTPPKKGHV